jgi:hypothetical protein
VNTCKGDRTSVTFVNILECGGIVNDTRDNIIGCGNEPVESRRTSGCCTTACHGGEVRGAAHHNAGRQENEVMIRTPRYEGAQCRTRREPRAPPWPR